MPPPVIDAQVLQIVEALLTASPEPLTPPRLKHSLGRDDLDLGAVIEALRNHFEQQNRPLDILAIADGYQLVTKPQFQPYLDRLHLKTGKLVLSRAALEALAVIAYRQPVNRAEIDRIRSVNSSGVLRTLLEKTLITIKGRDQGPGRALLYGTTRGFLEVFGLNRLDDLPKLKEIDDLLGEGETFSRSNTLESVGQAGWPAGAPGPIPEGYPESVPEHASE